MEAPTDIDAKYHVFVDGDLFCRFNSEREAADGAIEVKQRLPRSKVAIRNTATDYEVEVPDL
jgi:hypothetical protein